jgi:toxin ParE1/3/4
LKVEVSLRARDDLRGIRADLAEKSPGAADRLLLKIVHRFEQLRDFPTLGRDRSELGRPCGGLLIENYIAFYIVETNRIVIVRVLDGRMDISRETSQ